MVRSLRPSSNAAVPAASQTIDTTGPTVTMRKRPQGILAAACTACQRRKTRCDGKRPCCRACMLKNTSCSYEVAEGQSRVGAIKQRNNELEAKLTSSLDILWSLKNMPADEAVKLLECIRTSSDPSTVLDSAGQYEGLGDSGNQSQWSAGLSGRDSDTPLRCSDNMVSEDRVYYRIDFPGPEPLAVLKSAACRASFSFFLKSTGNNAHTYTQEQGDTVFKDVLDHDSSCISKASFCEMCSIAAVGAQYSQSHISSTTGQIFYNLAKQLLDDILAVDPLRAMKVCALLAMYNIVIEGTVAFSFIEMGLSLGYSQGLHTNHRPSALDTALWLDYKRTWRTLMCCKGWLVAILDFVSWNDWMADIITSWDLSSEGDFPIQDLIQMHFTKVAILKAKIFRNTLVFTSLTIDSINDIKDSLRQWYEELPHPLWLTAVAKITLNPESRRGIYLLHCVHLGAMILVQRRIFQAYMQATGKNPALAGDKINELSSIIQEGFTAGEQSARILGLLLDGNAVFQRCSLCIFQSYISTLNVMFMVAIKLLNGHLPSGCAEGLTVATKSLAVLEFCAKADNTAYIFCVKLRDHHESLLSIVEDRRTTDQARHTSHQPSATPSTYDWRHLSDLLSGDSKLHQTAHELMELICTPFSDVPEPSQFGVQGCAAQKAPQSKPTPEAEGAAREMEVKYACDTGTVQYVDACEENAGLGMLSDLTAGPFITGPVSPAGWTTKGDITNTTSL